MEKNPNAIIAAEVKVHVVIVYTRSSRVIGSEPGKPDMVTGAPACVRGRAA